MLKIEIYTEKNIKLPLAAFCTKYRQVNIFVIYQNSHKVLILETNIQLNQPIIILYKFHTRNF